MKKRLYYLLSMVFRRKVFLLGAWDDSLIWCPSQCSREFMWRGQVKELYLRWRHDDPWKAEIITYRSDGPKWSRLDIPDFTSDGDLDKIKRAAILAAKELLNGSRHDRAAIEQRAKEDLAAVIFKEIDAREWDFHGRLPVTTMKAIITRELRKKPKE